MRAVDSSVYLNFFVPATLTSSMDLLEIMQFRKGIEVEAARLAAENATEEDVVLLRQLFEQCTEGRKNMRTFASRNTDFHFEIDQNIPQCTVHQDDGDCLPDDPAGHAGLPGRTGG